MSKLAVVALLLIILQACSTNPVTGDSQFAMSEKWGINAGKQYHQEILKQYSVYDDPELQNYVNDIGQRLAKKSHRPDLPFTFTLLDSPQVNAFALPGGYVYVTRGIMAYMTKESHLAGVIGHEIGHVTGRHGAQRARQQQIAGVASTIVLIGTGSQELGQASQMLGGALMSGYGRKQELESDRLGAEYIAKNNYAVDDMIGVIGILKDQELFARERAEAEGRPTQSYHGHDLSSTHPRNDQRLQEVIKAADKFRDISQPEPDNGRFLTLTNGMSFGESEAQGITRGNKFYHKALDLFVEFPEGWSLQNSPTQLLAVAPDGTQAISMQMDKVAPPVDASKYLTSKFGQVSKTKKISTSEDQAYAGVATISDEKTGETQEMLVSMISRGDQAFIVSGLGKTVLPNRAFYQVAKSVRKLKKSERSFATGHKLKLVEAKRGDTIASLAKKSNLDDYAEAKIRLINNLYPDGEPTVGQMVKIIE